MVTNIPGCQISITNEWLTASGTPVQPTTVPLLPRQPECDAPSLPALLTSVGVALERPKISQSNIGAFDDLELAANRCLVGWMFRQPREEIKMHDRRPKQVHSVESIAQALNLERIVFGQEREILRQHKFKSLAWTPLASRTLARRPSLA